MTVAARYMRAGLGKGTLKSYDCAWVYYCSFCRALDTPHHPVNLPVVCAYIVHCFTSRKLQPSTIKAAVAGIQFHLRCLDPSVQSLLGNPSVRLLFNGLRKERPQGNDRRLPITLPILHHLVSVLRAGCFNAPTDVMLEAVCLMAFYGFMRCDEFTCRSSTFLPMHDLSLGDLTVDTCMYTVVLKHSKGVKAGVGTPVVISRIDSSFCPLSSMAKYLRWR